MNSNPQQLILHDLKTIFLKWVFSVHIWRKRWGYVGLVGMRVGLIRTTKIRFEHTVLNKASKSIDNENKVDQLRKQGDKLISYS